jgi:hypothetical protein
MRTILAVLLLLVLPMQDPAPGGHYENDPDAYCLAGPPMPNDKNGHECHCKLMCSPRVDGSDAPAYRIEDASCVTYCASSKCRCHPDETCDPPMVHEAPK